MAIGSVYFFYEDTSFPLPIKKKSIKKWLRSTIVSKGFKLENINIIFCSDDYLLKVNREYLQHDFFTDIITFDYSIEKNINGDLFISYDRIVENAKDNKVPFQEEILRVIIHGVLHLLGLNDKSETDKLLMTEEEDSALARFPEFT